MMLRRRLERLVSLDARTKELIASVEKVVTDATDVNHFREQLDIYQDEIRENIASMSNILEELQSSRSGQLSFSPGPHQPVAYNKEQLSFLQTSYRKAIFKATCQLEAMERNQLVGRSTTSGHGSDGADPLSDTYETSVELTRDMTAYARQLADEVKLGAINAELLEDSSNQIASNLTELKDMGAHVGQSRRLTTMLYRRRLTSYVLYTLAFTFYFLSVVSIFLNRVPLGSWLLPSSYL